MAVTSSSARRAAGRAGGPANADGANRLPAATTATNGPDGDPSRQFQALQDAALRRALAAHLAEEEGLPEGRGDAAFARNVRLAAVIARLRLALGVAGKTVAGKDGDGAAAKAELVIYKLPDNGRE